MAAATPTTRIIIVGAESTGKTTLAQRLAQHYCTVWAPEVGRSVVEAKLARDGKLEWSSEDFIAIARAKCAQEEELAARCRNALLICDTDAFGTSIWHERYMGARSEEVEAVAEERPTPELYLLPEVKGIPFVQDGTRDGEHLREWMFGRFVERLGETGRRFAVLKGGYEEVFQQAIVEIDGVLRQRDSHTK